MYDQVAELGTGACPQRQIFLSNPVIWHQQSCSSQHNFRDTPDALCNLQTLARCGIPPILIPTQDHNLIDTLTDPSNTQLLQLRLLTR